MKRKHIKKISPAAKTGKAVFVIFAVTLALDAVTAVAAIRGGNLKSANTNNINKIISDNLPFENGLNTVASYVNNAVNENYSGNVFNNGGALLERSKIPQEAALGQTAIYVNNFKENFPDVPVYATYVPTSSAVYYESLPESDTSSLLSERGDFFLDSLNDNIRKINVFSSLHSAKEDYIYYRTDTHWTPYGAFCAYKKIIRRLGFSPVDYSDYSIEHELTEFYGNLYKKSRYTGIYPDHADKFVCDGGSAVQSVEKVTKKGKIYTSNDLFDREYLSSENPLDYYTGKKSSVIKITTNEDNDKNLVIIGDSYTDEMLVFFVQNYHTITLIRPANLTEKEFKAANIKNATEVLFMCTLDTYSNYTAFGKLCEYLKN